MDGSKRSSKLNAFFTGFGRFRKIVFFDTLLAKLTEEQILAALRQAEGGTTVVEVCRQVGISEQTFYLWKRKYAGLGLSELRELRQLRDENTKLKRLVADLSLDRHMLQEIVRKKL
jgi:putative transposase